MYTPGLLLNSLKKKFRKIETCEWSTQHWVRVVSLDLSLIACLTLASHLMSSDCAWFCFFCLCLSIFQNLRNVYIPVFKENFAAKPRI